MSEAVFRRGAHIAAELLASRLKQCSSAGECQALADAFAKEVERARFRTPDEERVDLEALMKAVEERRK